MNDTPDGATPGPRIRCNGWSLGSSSHDDTPFSKGYAVDQDALRMCLLEASLLYLVGVIVIWAIAGTGGDPELWEIPVALVVTGGGTLLILMVLPLVVGQRVIRRWRQVEPDTALRYAVAGWPIAMLVIFGIFIAPGGITRGTLFDLGGSTICLGGFCGIILPFVVAVVAEALIAVFGPGLIGILLARELGI